VNRLRKTLQASVGVGLALEGIANFSPCGGDLNSMARQWCSGNAHGGVTPLEKLSTYICRDVGGRGEETCRKGGDRTF